MEWKTWTAQDNYAADGIADTIRLKANIQELAAILNADFGFTVTLAPITVDGYSTIPFADFLQAVEDNSAALQVFADVDYTAPRTWTAGDSITHDGPNRWEQNGKLIEDNIKRGKACFKRCGLFSLGRSF